MTLKHLSRIRWISMLCVVLAVPGAHAHAARQETPELRGAVRDEAGRVLVGASVTLIDAAQQRRSVLTDATGTYVFDTIAPGEYQLLAELDGFASVNRQITIAASAAVVNLRMRMTFDQRVDVVGSLAEFRRATGLSPVGLTLGPEQMTVLPNDPDMMLQVLRELSATTGRADQVEVYVDGQPVSSRLPPKAAIQSIRISTNSFAPEFAEPSAGLVEIITKPANAGFRGEWQGTLNDSHLNSRNFFEDRRQPSATQAYTGYFGGPIVPGSWSFLGYAGHWNRDERLVVNTTVASPERPVPQRFVESVATPARVDSSSLRTDFIATPRHLFSLEYAHTEDSHRNLGLESGLDLPERGVNRDMQDDSARLAAVSTFGERVTSELRIRGRRRALKESALTTTPAVLVLDAFNTGGNQAALRQDRVTREASLTQTVSYADEWQTIRGGVQVDLLRLNEQRQTNHGGTFVFGSEIGPDGRVVATPFERYLRTVRGVPGYGPSSFSIARGEPSIGFDDWQVSLFFQEDMHYVKNLTFSAGVRYGLQKHAHASWFDLAPRGGLAWTPGGSANHMIRAAAGLFYGRLPPDMTIDTLRYDGVAVEELVVDRPSFFLAIPPELNATLARPTIRLKDRVHAPLTTSATTSYEWQVTRTVFTSVGYTYGRGIRLLRSRNINARNPATGLALHPDRGPMLQFESTGRSNTHELRVTARRSLTRLSVFGTYIRRSSLSDTDGPYTIPADSFTLRNEYGRAADDERDRVVIGSWVNLPWDLSMSTLLTIGSGRPFNITSGWDNDGDLLFLDRPAPGSEGAPGVMATAFGNFDLQVDPGEPMIARNAGQGPSQLVLNLGLAKTLRFGDSTSGGSAPYAIFSVSAENVTNRVNFADFNGVVTSPLFGAANRALNPRRIELSARFGF